MDGTYLAHSFVPSITTLAVPIPSMSEAAIDVLLQKIQFGGKSNQTLIFKAVLVENNSTSKAAPLRLQ